MNENVLCPATEAAAAVASMSIELLCVKRILLCNSLECRICSIGSFIALFMGIVTKTLSFSPLSMK